MAGSSDMNLSLFDL